MNVYYGKTILDSSYRPDFVVYGEVIVELKTVAYLQAAHSRQVIHYLKATGYGLALLMNFSGERMEFRRFINSPQGPAPV